MDSIKPSRETAPGGQGHESRRPAGPADAGRPSRQTIGRKKVLIVEDSKVQAQMYLLLFPRADWEVIFAEDGKQALNTLTRELNFSLIISDINMPEMNGVDFVKMVRRIGLAHCPIIMISTQDNLALLEESLKFGASSYVIKPWQLTEMRGLVEKLASKG